MLLAEQVRESHDSQKGSCDDGLLCHHYYKERTSIHVFVHESVYPLHCSLSLPPSLSHLRSSRPTSGERTGFSVAVTVFLWDKWSGRVVNMLVADSHVIN